MRWQEETTLEELGSLLSYVFRGSHEILPKAKALEYWSRIETTGSVTTRVVWDEPDKSVIAFLFTEGVEQLVGAIRFPEAEEPQELDLQFANCLVRVFNEDVRTAPDFLRQAELWMSLRQTQFRRAIARFSAFSTLPMVKWMQAIESSTSLRYEGKPFTLCVFMSKKLKWVADPLGSRFIAFGAPLSFEKAILNEKWIRAAVDGLHVGLLGVGHKGDIVGLIAIAGYKGKADKWAFAPHESLVGLQDLLLPGTMVFITSEHGDVYVMLPNGAVFHKTQGRWRYLNYAATHMLLSNRLGDKVAISILRMALDLSYERRGALLCSVRESGSLQAMVPDSGQSNRANGALRDAMKGLNITDPNQREVIAAAATADGAVIINADGFVLDAACMVGDPSEADMKAVGQHQLQRMPGARSTAAWNASIYGIAIKVSEDGPITVFENGTLLTQIG